MTEACRRGALEVVSAWGHPDQDEGPRVGEKREPRWAAPERAEPESQAEPEPETEAGANDRLGEVGYAYVIPRTESTPTEAQIIAWCRDQMANFKVPRHVELVEQLPLNPSGKVLKFALRDRARKTVAG